MNNSLVERLAPIEVFLSVQAVTSVSDYFKDLAIRYRTLRLNERGFEMRERARSEPGIDRLGLGSLRIRQSPGVFKFTVDPILLAAFARIYPQDRVLDLGTGAGVIPLWLAGYRGVKEVTGLEIQEEVAALAVKNVRLNDLQEQVRIIQGDLRTPSEELRGRLFDWVISNPPYLKASAGTAMANPLLAQAKFELTCDLEDIIRAAAVLTPNNGRMALVHLPERLPELMILMKKYNFEPKRLCLVHPKPESAPHRVLIEGRKSGRPGLFILKPFYIHQPNGEFTPEMEEVYKGEWIKER